VGDCSIKTTQNIGLTQSTLKKSMQINKFKKIDYRKYNDYFMVADNEKLEPSIFQQIITEYQKTLEEALNEKEIQPKKVIRLSEEMASNIQQALARCYYRMQ
jgi:F0F1-type ATP synthase delta subunit